MWRQAGDSVRALRLLRTAREIYYIHDGSRSVHVKKIDIEIQRVNGDFSNENSTFSSFDSEEEEDKILASYNVDLDTRDYK